MASSNAPATCIIPFQKLPVQSRRLLRHLVLIGHDCDFDATVLLLASAVEFEVLGRDPPTPLVVSIRTRGICMTLNQVIHICVPFQDRSEFLDVCPVRSVRSMTTARFPRGGITPCRGVIAIRTHIVHSCSSDTHSQQRNSHQQSDQRFHHHEFSSTSHLLTYLEKFFSARLYK